MQDVARLALCHRPGSGRHVGGRRRQCAAPRRGRRMGGAVLRITHRQRACPPWPSPPPTTQPSIAPWLQPKRIRSQGTSHPRIAIRDPRDARLQHADLVILGGLNEGTWPQAADPGPWLNRAMRATLGLAAPEERLGAAAHDFVSQLGAERVVLTRAAKVDGAPTVASRWVLRLQALVAGMGLSLEAEQPWLAWARARNGTGAAAPGARARAAAAGGAAPARAQRHHHRDLDCQPLCGVCPPHLASGAAAAAGRAAWAEPARPDRARGARPLCPALPDQAAARHRRGADDHRR